MKVLFHEGSAQEFVPSCVDTGISIEAHAIETLRELNSMPFQALPEAIKAALTLRNSVGGSVSPADVNNVQQGMLDPKPQEGIPITIFVGKKP